MTVLRAILPLFPAVLTCLPIRQAARWRLAVLRLGFAAFVLVIAAGAAQGETLPREFTITPEALDAPPEFIRRVIVPEANCAAVSEKDSLLVVGRRGKDEKQLAVFRLDAAGQPAAEPTWITLPKPESLAANFNYPLGLLFHPTLPLLYVWQDVNGPPAAQQDQSPEFTAFLEFDHLIIFAIKDGALEQVQTGVHGAGFHCGLEGGTVGLDYGAKTLYVPNATTAAPTSAGIASYVLDEEGLPGETPDAGAPEKGATKPVKNMTVSKGAKKTPRLLVLPKKMQTGHYFPSGTGWYPGSEALIMGVYSGCVMYDVHDGSLRQTSFGIPILSGPCFITGHPTLPVLYLCLQDHSHFFAVAQVNGFVSLLPQEATVMGAHLAGTPVVMAKRSILAIGDTKSLHLLGLSADGKLDGRDQRMTLPCAIARGLAYSEKFDRLFVAVDKAD